jgi:hypothetical protein
MMFTGREGFKSATPGYLCRYTNDAVHLAGSRNNRVQKGKESSSSDTCYDLILANLRLVPGTHER